MRNASHSVYLAIPTDDAATILIIKLEPLEGTTSSWSYYFSKISLSLLILASVRGKDCPESAIVVWEFKINWFYLRLKYVAYKSRRISGKKYSVSVSLSERALHPEHREIR